MEEVQDPIEIWIQNNPEIFLTGIALLFIFIVYIFIFKGPWPKLSKYYKSKHNTNFDGIGEERITLNNTTYKQTYLKPTDNGLFMKKFPFHLLFIPWSTFSRTYTRQVDIKITKVDQYYVDIKTPEGDIQMNMDKKLYDYLLKQGYLLPEQ